MWKGCEENATFLKCWRELNLCSHYENEYGSSSENQIWMVSSNFTPRQISRQNYNLKRYMHPYLYSSTVHNNRDMEKTECPSTDEWINAAAKSLQSCSTLCDPIDGSPPGFPVPGILQTRTLEWVAISFSNAWKWKVKVKSLSRVRPSATP